MEDGASLKSMVIKSGSSRDISTELASPGYMTRRNPRFTRHLRITASLRAQSSTIIMRRASLWSERTCHKWTRKYITIVLILLKTRRQQCLHRIYSKYGRPWINIKLLLTSKRLRRPRRGPKSLSRNKNRHQWALKHARRVQLRRHQAARAAVSSRRSFVRNQPSLKRSKEKTQTSSEHQRTKPLAKYGELDYLTKNCLLITTFLTVSKIIYLSFTI